MSRLFTIAVASLVAAFVNSTAWSQVNQSGAAANGATGQVGAQAPGAAANAAGQARGGVTPQSTVDAAGQFGAQAPGIQSNAAAQARGGIGVQPGFRVGDPRMTGFAGFNGISQTPFFADPSVQQELSLTLEQFRALQRAYQQNWNRYNQGVLGIGNDMPQQQRLQQLQALEAQFNQGFGQAVNTTFTDPRLRQRFDQLNLQFRNFGAFNDPMVQNQLNLTERQQRQIRRMQNEWREQMRRLRRAGNDIDPRLVDQQFNQMQQLYQAQLNQVLTPQQRQTWRGLIGDEYPFSRASFMSDDGILEGPPNPAGIEPYSQRQRQAGSNRPGTASAARQQRAQNTLPNEDLRDAQPVPVDIEPYGGANQRQATGGTDRQGTRRATGHQAGQNQNSVR